MNYSEMSDFEVNRLVAMKIEGVESNDDGTPNFAVDCFLKGDGNSAYVLWCGDDEFSPFDPCNSWADAGPIIQGNYLSIECDDMFDVPIPSSYWRAHNPKGNHYTDENPLRAAMIAFLMMQEKK